MYVRTSRLNWLLGLVLLFEPVATIAQPAQPTPTADAPPVCPPGGCDGDAPIVIAPGAAEGRLIGGKTAGPTPWQVSVSYGGTLVRRGTAVPEWTLRHSCGGALIAPDWVLTAGHCIVVEKTAFMAPGNLEVRFGALRLDSADLQRVGVKRIIRHPDYQREPTQNDVALLQLARSVTLQPGRVEVIALPDQPTAVGQPVQLSGWGKTESPVAGGMPVELRFIRLKVLNNSACVNAGFTKVSDTDLCAGAADVSQCSGDSGGPLVWKGRDEDGRDRWALVGSVSRSLTDCPAGKPGVYARIASFTDWIRTTIKPAVRRAPAR